jgi:hypothetical protein
MYKTTKGTAMFSNRLELRMPLIPNIIGLDGFFDACAVKPTVGDMFTNLSIDELYYLLHPSSKTQVPKLMEAIRSLKMSKLDIMQNCLFIINKIHRANLLKVIYSKRKKRRDRLMFFDTNIHHL